MKRPIIIALSVLCALFSIQADDFSHTFVFNPEKFSINPAAGDSLIIRSTSEASSHPDPSFPDLPLLSRRIAIPGNTAISNCAITLHKHLIRTGVAVQNTTSPVPTSIPLSSVTVRNIGYPATIYPESACELISTNKMGCINVASFIVCPFQYDATAHNLYFIDSITVTLSLAESMMQRAPMRTLSAQLDILAGTVDNPEILQSIPTTNSIIPEEYSYDYLIITRNLLKEAFEPLATWKRKKGVRSKIITVEDIEKNYTGTCTQEKIKRCIFDQNENYGVMYVLLGGDQWQIPSMPCYVNTDKVGTAGYISTDIPADVYYACPDNYNWDTNGDGRRGEMLGDRINIMPQVHVTRALVDGNVDVTAFVNRIIDYEQSPKFTPIFFQGGTVLNNESKNLPYCAGETMADLVYNEVIKEKVYIYTHKFFDTYRYNGLPFTNQNFKAELEKGNPFAEIICHGSATGWYKFNSGPLFGLDDAGSLNNTGHTLVTTSACFTNAFDSAYTKCLSEVLITNPKSGVIGYLGSSREGFHYPNTSELSMAYEIDFYDRLLNNDYRPYVKHFGEIVTHMKHTLCGLAETDGYYRWLHYSINAIGDPETPIFNSTPREFQGILALGSQFGLNVNTGRENARVCISSVNDGIFYEVKTGEALHFDAPLGTYDVWVTEPGFIPYHKTVVSKYMEVINPDDPIIHPIHPLGLTSVAPDPSFARTKVKYTSGTEVSDLKIMITNVNGLQSYTFTLDPMVNEKTLDLSSLPSGVYVAVLLADGTPTTDTPIRFVKQ